MNQLLDMLRRTGFLLVLLLNFFWSTVETSDETEPPARASSDPKHEIDGLLYLGELDDDSQTTLTDSKLISSMRVNAALGGACLFIFGLLNSHFKMYRLRMSLRRVTIKPPILPKRGWPILWMWLWHTIATSDDQFLASSGLDALMFIKTFSLGIQLFFPLAIIGAAVLIPVHKEHSSGTDDDDDDTSALNLLLSNSEKKEPEKRDSFLRMTTSNLNPGSSVFWLHFICVYLYVFYALFLLYLHQKRFIALRHRYLTARESQHMWKTEKSEEIEETEQTEKGFQRYPNMVRSWLSNQLSKLLEDSNAETSTAGAMSMLASTSKPNRSKVVEAFYKTGSLRPSSLSFRRAPTADRTSFQDVSRRSTKKLLTQSERITSQSSDPDFRFDTPSSTRYSSELGYDAWSGARQASGSGPLGESPFKLEKINEPAPPEAVNEKPDTSIMKWWLLTDNIHEIHSAAASEVKTEGVFLSRQSVRFLKTVVTTDTEYPLSKIAVCAQMYCALLTNFPSAFDHDKHEKSLIDRWMSMAYKQTIARLARMAKQCLDGPVDLERLGSNVGEARNEPLLSLSDRDDADFKEEAMIEMEKQLISDTFNTFFGDEFVQAVPIRDHKKVDLLLAQWDHTMGMLERCQYHNSVKEKRKKHQPCKWWSFLCCYMYGVGEAVDAEEYYTDKIHSLEKKISESQAEVLKQTHANSWLIIFKTQKAASIASQVVLHTENAKNFRVGPAPGPDEMNWQSLWKSKREKDLRQTLVIPFIVLLLSFPVGILAGAVSQLNELFCGDKDDKIHWDLYCKHESYHPLVTAWMPALVVAIWQNIAMPNALYYLVQASCGCDSFSQVERRIGHLFFTWDTANIFLGAMLGGSVFYKVNAAVKRPQDLIDLLGVSVPASSNFFVNYVTLRTFFLLPYRLLVPHTGIWYYVCILGGKLGLANTPRDRALLWASRSVRYGREYGSLLLIFLISIAYSVVSPIILPITLAFFLLAWLIWRYQMLYVFVRKYESGGRMWPLMVNRMIFILWIFQLFTCCVFITKEAYWQAAILWISIPIILRRFHKYCASKFKPRTMNVPLEMTQNSPHAEVTPEVYSPPALCQHCAGWHPEYMKAWEGWRTAAYTI